MQPQTNPGEVIHGVAEGASRIVLDVLGLAWAAIKVSAAGEQLLDLFDGLRVVRIADRVDARLACAGYAAVGVVDEYRLVRADVRAGWLG